MKKMNADLAAPIRVLLADDHEVVRAGTRQFLEHSGEILVIAEVADGAEALQEIIKKQPDVAILDIHMPSMSGIDVARQLRARQQNTRILILTAYDDEPYIRAALKAGANGILLKNSSPDEIVRGVKDIFSSKAVIDQELALKIVMTGDTPAPDLSDRECEVLQLVAQGISNKAVAASLQISERTVQNHLAHIFEKLQAGSRTEAVMKATRLGLIASYSTHDLKDP